MNWKPLDDDGTPKGVEGKYDIENNTLIIYAGPTNKGWDWISDLLAIPVPLEGITGLFGPWCHAGFIRYAYWLTGAIWGLLESHPKVTELLITGYSMGGGIAQITGLLCERWIDSCKVRVVSIDGPRTTTVLPQNIKLIRNCGSLIADIPVWFEKAEETVLNAEWHLFWKAHADYDIETIIEDHI